MKLIANNIYHIYNQGNNQEKIFYSNEHYLIFVQLIKKFISPHCNILSYCLMPNHFHFLVYTTGESAKKIKIGNLYPYQLSNGFRLLQSVYAQIINKERGRSGSLFRQKAKAKNVSEGENSYSFTAFHYIHQNPVKTGLVLQLEDWPYSSYKEYFFQIPDLVNDFELAKELLGIDIKNISKKSLPPLDPNKIKYIF